MSNFKKGVKTTRYKFSPADKVFAFGGDAKWEEVVGPTTCWTQRQGGAHSPEKI